MIRWLALGGLLVVAAGVLSGCTIRTSTLDAILRAATEPTSPSKVVSNGVKPAFAIVVVDQCSGSDSVVDFWLDGDYMGTIDYQRSFKVFGHGWHSFRARGVGPYGRTWKGSHYFGGNYYWYLC